MTHFTWSGSHRFSASRVERPGSIEALQELVRSHDRIHVFGARHSFNDVADTSGLHLSLRHLNRIIDLKVEHQTVVVEGGIRYSELCPLLHEKGYALSNTASLPHISVAGAIATATHGSGDGNPCIAAGVRSLDVIGPDGERLHLALGEPGETFHGVPISLGGLGPVVAIELAIEPTFTVFQSLYCGISFASFKANLDEIMASAYSVSLFTDWVTEGANQIWLKARADAARSWTAEKLFFDASPATEQLHPIDPLAAAHCTPQMEQPGPWHLRLPHFLMSGVSSQGAELQSEYFVPRRYGQEAVEAIQSLGPTMQPLLRISEVRSIAPDPLWLSPSQDEPLLAFHFTWRPQRDALFVILPQIEAALTPFEVRPHWGKLFTMSAGALAQLYPRLSDFDDLLRHFDPESKFRNAFIDRLTSNQ